MEKLIDIDKLTEFNLLKKKVEEFRQQRKCLESENRALKQFIEILKDPVLTTFRDRKYASGVCECAMA